MLIGLHVCVEEGEGSGAHRASRNLLLCQVSSHLRFKLFFGPRTEVSQTAHITHNAVQCSSSQLGKEAWQVVETLGPPTCSTGTAAAALRRAAAFSRASAAARARAARCRCMASSSGCWVCGGKGVRPEVALAWGPRRSSLRPVPAPAPRGWHGGMGPEGKPVSQKQTSFVPLSAA